MAIPSQYSFTTGSGPYADTTLVSVKADSHAKPLDVTVEALRVDGEGHVKRQSGEGFKRAWQSEKIISDLEQAVAAVWLRFPGGIARAAEIGFNHAGILPYVKEAAGIQHQLDGLLALRQSLDLGITAAEKAFHQFTGENPNTHLPDGRGKSADIARG